MIRTLTPSLIQSYEHCPRRYYLNSIRQLTWPSVIPASDPAVVKRIRMGNDFHLLIQQYIRGIPLPALRSQSTPEVQEWLDRFLQLDPLPKNAKYYPEIELSFPMNGFLWLGKIDLLAVSKDSIEIFDWKTTERAGSEKSYRDVPQTRLYRWLAKSCSSRILGTDSCVPAACIRMTYWFPKHPESPVILPYDEASFAADTAWMEKLARDLDNDRESAFTAVPNPSRCETCPFVSYCSPKPAVPLEDEEQFPLWDDEIPPADPEERVF